LLKDQKKKIMKKIFLIQVLMCFFFIPGLNAQEFVPNYDEEKVPAYILPDPLVFNDGTKVAGSKDWEKRRAELYSLFENEVYGKSPEWKGEIVANEMANNQNALSGTAVMKEVRLTLKNGVKTHSMVILLYLPKSVKKAPLFLGYNFNGNHTVTSEPQIGLADIWPRKPVAAPVRGNESERGNSADSWQVNELISRGYGLATIYYCDVDPDFDDGFKNGVHSLFDQQPDETSWGSVAAWAWGLSRALDYLETVPSVDSKRVAVMGHSRLGKAALWAGASDSRFAMVISNNSGCGGAALSKRKYGETVGRINRSFPHWFCENFNKYNEKEEDLPIDQHELLALIAPRPVYVASAQDDKWADPKGEFLSCVHASPVYIVLGKKGFPASEMPAVNSPVTGGSIGYHIRTGGHAVTLFDWQQYISFADKYLK
jgi:hypothetical protein